MGKVSCKTNFIVLEVPMRCFFAGLTFTHAHWLFTNKDSKTLAAFVARPFIERFVELMLTKFCDVNDSNVMHCTACKPPFSQASSGPLLHGLLSGDYMGKYMCGD